MGLLVAGITNGASMIENAKITSLKREVDDHIRDVFTFYARTGKLPGDVKNVWAIGYQSGIAGQTYTNASFPAPYNKNINLLSGPFVDLYLYGISSFKPNPEDSGITATFTQFNIKTDIADRGGVPTSKVYKDIVYVYRTAENNPTNHVHSLYGLYKKITVQFFVTEVDINPPTINKRIMNIVLKLESKFDDGAHNGGIMRAYCNGSHEVYYSNAKICTEIMFPFNIF
jgi:hypothetical protein